MSNTIREEQMEMLRKSLSKPQFKASFAFYEATGRPLGVCHPSGHWLFLMKTSNPSLTPPIRA